MARLSSKTARFRDILCPVDFSSDSRAALRVAAEVAAVGGGSLTVLYVSDPMLLAAAAAGYNQQLLDESASRELDAFVRKTVASARLARVTMKTEVRVGTPPREIVRRAGQGRFDLIVLGTRGLNGARRLLLGSTTADVLRRARVPVLTIPGALGRRTSALHWPPRQLLGAIELGAHARGDAASYAAVAALLAAPLTLLHVAPVPPAPAWYARAATDRSRVDAATAAVQRTLDRLRARHADVVDAARVLSGDPATGIEAAASARAGTVILMMLRSRPGLFGSRAGAVAYEVLCRAVAPVLALPPGGFRRRTAA